MSQHQAKRLARLKADRLALFKKLDMETLDEMQVLADSLEKDTASGTLFQRNGSITSVLCEYAAYAQRYNVLQGRVNHLLLLLSEHGKTADGQLSQIQEKITAMTFLEIPPPSLFTKHNFESNVELYMAGTLCHNAMVWMKGQLIRVITQITLHWDDIAAMVKRLDKGPVSSMDSFVG